MDLEHSIVHRGGREASEWSGSTVNIYTDYAAKDDLTFRFAISCGRGLSDIRFALATKDLIPVMVEFAAKNPAIARRIVKALQAHASPKGRR